jgi:hypothetical protein
MSNEPEERPPFLGTWKRVYAGVLFYLFVVIMLFLWFTLAWNR